MQPIKLWYSLEVYLEFKKKKKKIRCIFLFGYYKLKVLTLLWIFFFLSRFCWVLGSRSFSLFFFLWFIKFWDMVFVFWILGREIWLLMWFFFFFGILEFWTLDPESVCIYTLLFFFWQEVETIYIYIFVPFRFWIMFL